MHAPAKLNSAKPYKRAKLWLWRAALAVLACALFYAAFLLLGFVPINNNYAPPPADNRVRLFIRSNEIHTDLAMPVVHDELGIDWRTLFPPEHFAASRLPGREHHELGNYVAVGWGDRGFFVETPTWADLKIATVFKALFMPSEGVLHAEYLQISSPDEYLHEVYVTRQEYRELVEFVRSTVGATDERGAAVTATEVTYGAYDRFYLATGKYHLFNTCNQWTGRGLARAGVRVGIWTPLKPHMLCWLPNSPDNL